MTSIAVIGAGNIGEALIGGLIDAGTDPHSIIATSRRSVRAQELAQQYGIQTTTDNSAAAEKAGVVFLCVKPAQIVDVLAEISPALDAADSTVVVSLAAGVTLGAMEEAVSAGTPVVRVMPNTPMRVGKGMSVCATGRFVTQDQYDLVAHLLSSVGRVVRLEEKLVDAAGAISGASPAYYFLVTEALVDAGVSQGIPRAVAQELAAAAAAGAGALLDTDDADPVALRAAVSSPGGSTIAALRELEESGLRGAFYRAVAAGTRRSAELGTS